MRKALITAAFVLLTACTPQQMTAWNTLGADDPTAPTIAPTDRASALALPATDVTQWVHGELVHVVAWIGDDGRDRGHFVYDTPTGRWLVQLNSEPLHAYVWPVTEDPCFADPFGQLPRIEC